MLGNTTNVRIIVRATIAAATAILSVDLYDYY
jgi:hypothetical protein